MNKSVLDGKHILTVDDEPDVLTVLREEIMNACSQCTIDEATTYDEALEFLQSKDYDIVILDIMGVQGFDLLEFAIKKHLRVVMLTAHALNSQALKRSRDLGARAYLPKDKLGEIVPFLEDVFKYDFETGWKRLFEKLSAFFNDVFESDWEKKTGLTWREWGKPY
jgi:CheY-like chemotaxis protein